MPHDRRDTGSVNRRAFVVALGTVGASSWMPSLTAVGRGQSDQRGSAAPEEEDVSPAEDLMREHGVLRRVLLVYAEVLRRFDAKAPLPPDALPPAADVVRRFGEDYHERQEEDGIFPAFEQAGRAVALVATLRRQHEAGRRCTATIQRLAPALAPPDAAGRAEAAVALRAFGRMYAPHADWEDTVLFPQVRDVVGARAYVDLGERFEDREHTAFGQDGFERMVGQVAAVERALGIDDLDAFTPR